MKIFFDTSVLIAAMVEKHPAHPRALPWLSRAKAEAFSWGVAAHSVAEAYAILTTLPLKPRISPQLACRLIRENIEGTATILALNPSEYNRLIKALAEQELTGGIVYDSIILQAALKYGADQLLTLNPRDFQRLVLDRKIKIVEI